MKKKQFKTESKKLLDMMINSIYTHREIFLRELISNASDAIDKLYFRSLTDSAVTVSRSDYAIFIEINKEERTLTISDNGCGMTAEEMESNLGTIAKSGSFDFKRENAEAPDVDIIGQFGVGFYSAFMVAKKITVISRPYGADEATKWESDGIDGYTVSECEKSTFGTTITLYLKDDGEEEGYSEFLEENRILGLVKKYSDYVRYPIKMNLTRRRLREGSESEYESYTECATLNSMVPLWKKPSSEVSEEEYASFYTGKFYDYEAPARVITQRSEGASTFTALMFIPKHAPFNYYTSDYEKGLELYSSGVMIMERCADLLPDYFGFVKGLVDSSDLSLNISREMLQHDRQLKVMARAIEKKIKSELSRMMESDREAYESFFDAFGIQLKYGLYSDYGAHKELLADLLIFRSSVDRGEKKHAYLSLKEYAEGMKTEQKDIYYASGESIEKIEMLPQVKAVKSHGFEILYLTDDVDEFALRILESYDGRGFKNVASEALDLASEDEREKAKAANGENAEMLGLMKEAIGSVSGVRFTASLPDGSVCLSSEGELSVEMARVLKRMPGAEGGAPDASLLLEININHPIKDRLISIYKEEPERVKKYARILYSAACLIGGVAVENPDEVTGLILELMI